MELNTEVTNNAVIINAAGRLDFGSSVAFQEQLEAVIRDAESPINAVLIDCSTLDYVSSAGLRTFLVGARSAKQRDLHFCVCGLLPSVQEVFKVSGFDRIVEVCADRGAALEQFASH